MKLIYITTFLIAACSLQPGDGSAAIKHRWSFNTPGMAEDSVGTADLDLVGTAGVSGGTLNLPGGAPSRSDYARATGVSLTEIKGTLDGSSGQGVTMEAWFTQDVIQFNIKVVMGGNNIGGGGANYFDFAPRRGSGLQRPGMTINDNSHSQTVLDSTLSVPVAAQPYYVAMIWDDATNTMSFYRKALPGGTLESASIGMGGQTLSDMGALNAFHLGAAVVFNDPDFDGVIDEFRIHDEALTTEQIELSISLGPNSLTVPEPGCYYILMVFLFSSWSFKKLLCGREAGCIR